MKLTIGHKEIVAGIVMFLDSRGVQGFNPETVHADFALSRGENRQLTCTLDEDAPVAAAVVPAAEAPKSSGATQTATTSAPVVQPQEVAPVVAAASTEPAEAAVAEAVAVIEEAASPVAEAEAENLFG